MRTVRQVDEGLVASGRAFRKCRRNLRLAPGRI